MHDVGFLTFHTSAIIDDVTMIMLNNIKKKNRFKFPYMDTIKTKKKLNTINQNIYYIPI